MWDFLSPSLTSEDSTCICAIRRWDSWAGRESCLSNSVVCRPPSRQDVWAVLWTGDACCAALSKSRGPAASLKRHFYVHFCLFQATPTVSRIFILKQIRSHVPLLFNPSVAACCHSDIVQTHHALKSLVAWLLLASLTSPSSTFPTATPVAQAFSLPHFIFALGLCS